jgi:glycosyl transferase family 25
MIDKIYIINLEKAKERRLRVEKQLKEYNISNYIFFNAIRPTDDELNKYPNLVSRNEKVEQTRGELGCLLSHINVMKDALKNNYKTIIIFEDVIDILDKEFVKKTEKEINSLNNDFEVLFLGANHRRKAIKKISDNIYQCRRSNCTFAYCIRANTMNRIIDNFNNELLTCPIDVKWWYIDYPINPIKFYCIIPHLINIFNSHSTITNKKNNFHAKVFLASQKKLIKGYT